MDSVGAVRRRYPRLRLQTRFALHAILLVAALFAAVIPVVLMVQESAILGMARDNGIRLVAIFAFSSVQALVADDFLGLRQVVNSLTRERNVRYAMILDPAGRVLIHSRVNETGAVYDDPLSRRALAATGPLFQETRSPQGDVLYDFSTPVTVMLERRAVARIGISIADELWLIRRTRNAILGLGVFALLVGLVWAHVQARRLTRPIRALAAGSAAIARGNLEHRIRLDREDEIGDLAGAFNRMADSLQARSAVDRELSSTLNLQTVLDVLVRHARTLCGADLAFLAHRDREASFAAVVACSGDRGSAIRGWEIRPGEGRAGRVLADGRPWGDADTRGFHGPAEDVPIAAEGVRASALVPIRLQEACVGVLGVGRRDGGIFGAEAAETLQRLADQAAVAIANALAYREIEELSRTLEAKVIERTRQLAETNAALEASHAKLRELDRLKSEFVSNVSHELRTPLTAIRMAVDNLLDGVVGEVEPVLGRYLATVKHNTDRLVRLITDLLDLSRIEAGRIELHLAGMDVLDTIQEVADSLRPMAAEKGLRLVVAASPAPLLAWADRDKVHQVLVNLAGNAVKFTPGGGTITLAARGIAGPAGTAAAGRESAPADGVATPQPTRQDTPAARPAVEVSVADTGEGIPPEELAAVFDKFHQVRRDGRHKTHGTGLGLTIARSLVELQGGRIWVESQVGRGSRFAFTLPAAPAPDRAPDGTATGSAP
jgi:signal transduction histidine kinase